MMTPQPNQCVQPPAKRHDAIPVRPESMTQLRRPSTLELRPSAGPSCLALVPRAVRWTLLPRAIPISPFRPRHDRLVLPLIPLQNLPLRPGPFAQQHRLHLFHHLGRGLQPPPAHVLGARRGGQE